MMSALREGFRAVGRCWGLAVLLLLVNAALAALLAVPLAATLEADLEETAAAQEMMYGFDHSWWKAWSERAEGWTTSFGPEIFGVGFAFRNLDLLLQGQLPARALAPAAASDDEDDPRALDPVILGLGLVYLFAHVFLTGGILGVFRGGQGTWTVRGLVHGSGFYAGRLMRVALLALLADALILRLSLPVSRWADSRALEAVSENAALAWTFGRYAVLLAALLFVHMVSSYAKAIVVLEERSSAILAMLSSLGFCLTHLGRTAGHYAVFVVASVALLGAFGLLDGAVAVVGYKTQAVVLAAFQTFLLARIGLRLALLAGQMHLYRSATVEGR